MVSTHTDLHEDPDSQVLNLQIFPMGILTKSHELLTLVGCLKFGHCLMTVVGLV